MEAVSLRPSADETHPGLCWLASTWAAGDETVTKWLRLWWIFNSFISLLYIAYYRFITQYIGNINCNLIYSLEQALFQQIHRSNNRVKVRHHISPRLGEIQTEARRGHDRSAVLCTPRTVNALLVNMLKNISKITSRVKITRSLVPVVTCITRAQATKAPVCQHVVPRAAPLVSATAFPAAPRAAAWPTYGVPFVPSRGFSPDAVAAAEMPAAVKLVRLPPVVSHAPLLQTLPLDLRYARLSLAISAPN